MAKPGSDKTYLKAEAAEHKVLMDKPAFRAAMAKKRNGNGDRKATVRR